MDFSKLDNPVWSALSEVHRAHVVMYDGIQFFPPSICPFGGFVDADLASKGMTAYAQLASTFYIVGDAPSPCPTATLNKDLVCRQMILHKPLELPIVESIVQLERKKQLDELYALVDLVQPGYFGKDTHLLGRYYGIYKDGMLVSAAGERMQTNDFTEVSAVVTHPEHTRQGYSKQLMIHTINNIFEQGKLPFLHVLKTNEIAVKMYDKLGFETRRLISFRQYKKIDND